jgi:hypothetical protein
MGPKSLFSIARFPVICERGKGQHQRLLGRDMYELPYIPRGIGLDPNHNASTDPEGRTLLPTKTKERSLVADHELVEVQERPT